ncbi:ribonuclease P 40kDa subunit-domain-containing protein, partial [Irpex rosettiformis]
EDWEEETSALFEWVGLANLGSQRLGVNDKPDPYIAVYEPPDGSKAGDLVHIQWKGFISRSFLHTVFRTITEDHSSPFVSVTGYAVLQSPVTYVGRNSKQQRIPGGESEDTWSLVLCREEKDGQRITHWVMGESIGKWDSRLG